MGAAENARAAVDEYIRALDEALGILGSGERAVRQASSRIGPTGELGESDNQALQDARMRLSYARQLLEDAAVEAEKSREPTQKFIAECFP